MSLSPSSSSGSPSLAEVVIQRTFAKPPKPFVDGEFLRALEHADDAPAPVTGAAPSAAEHSGGQPDAAGSRTAPRGDGPVPHVDIRV
jgi:hypothetical protein